MVWYAYLMEEDSMYAIQVAGPVLWGCAKKKKNRRDVEGGPACSKSPALVLAGS
jgi:hypothetical protein